MMDIAVATLSSREAEALLQGRHADPFAILGPHRLPVESGADAQWIVRVWLPGAMAVDLLPDGAAQLNMAESGPPGLFVAVLNEPLRAYRLRIWWPGGQQETEDPYSFPSTLGEMDIHLFSEGKHRHLGDSLGAQPLTIGKVPGVRFVVWAPNAQRVSVIGSFNGWDARRHVMRRHHGCGLWELFIPRLQPGELYKYDILGADNVATQRADPVALRTETPPATASVIAAPLAHAWQDGQWLEQRPQRQGTQVPMAIYELHAGSWMRDEHGDSLGWPQLAQRLIPYITQLGFTHIELMPVMEHPFGGSWGYQVLSQFAPTARYGTPDEFAAFVDACHSAGIGVILDWVPAHFPTDAHGLAHFDGTALYEYAHPFEGFHQDWDTFIYNLGRHEVRGFMIASALHWLRRFHVDGLRVDAVASMLYRDYSRKEGEWIPNHYGGRENLEAIDFLRQLNDVVAHEVPGAMVIAEESTAFPGVSHPTGEGGLGFAAKWNMGWMHDSLAYISEDPVNRRYHHHQLTFGLLYAFSETFILPISHDEVVHGKGSLLNKMPGDHWQKFANLRLYLAFMWTHPGKKLLFMGCEFGAWREWDHDGQLDWALLDKPEHQGIHRLVATLNQLYRQLPALHAGDHREAGFQWLIGDDTQNSVYAWLRCHNGVDPVLVIHNFTPIPRPRYRVGVPCAGQWRVLLNSDAGYYAGSDYADLATVTTEEVAAHGRSDSLVLDLPPLATLLLSPDQS